MLIYIVLYLLGIAPCYAFIYGWLSYVNPEEKEILAKHAPEVLSIIDNESKKSGRILSCLSWLGVLFVILNYFTYRLIAGKINFKPRWK